MSRKTSFCQQSDQPFSDWCTTCRGKSRKKCSGRSPPSELKDLEGERGPTATSLLVSGPRCAPRRSPSPSLCFLGGSIGYRRDGHHVQAKNSGRSGRWRFRKRWIKRCKRRFGAENCSRRAHRLNHALPSGRVCRHYHGPPAPTVW